MGTMGRSASGESDDDVFTESPAYNQAQIPEAKSFEHNSSEENILKKLSPEENSPCATAFTGKPETHKPSDTFENLFGFKLSELRTWKSAVTLMFRPEDPSSLAIVRILYGLLMFLDIPEERGLSDVDVRWGDPLLCHFPLLPFLNPPPLPWMCLVYLAMWIGALGIMLGYHFRTSCVLFTVPYWYIFLMETSTWNNHSYLFGLTAILLSRSSAHHCWSIDAIRFGWKNRPVPLWNYAALRFQFFLLYFLAGVKKTDPDWLGGYSMTNLGNHWVFMPFQLLLPPALVDYLIVHLTGFLLDLTIGFWMFFDKTRPIAFVFCAAFHFMNSRLFEIGMFPYVCLATMPLFCHNNWPRTLASRRPFKWLFGWRSKSGHTVTKPWIDSAFHVQEIVDAGCLVDQSILDLTEAKGESNTKEERENGLESEKTFNANTVTEAKPVIKENKKNVRKPTVRQNLTVILLLVHVVLQFFLPYSHFITKGYNNWTNGLYGYSWDMMVHTWDTILVVVKVVDKDSGEVFFLDPEAFVRTNRWVKHGNMVRRYAQCVQRNLKVLGREDNSFPSPDRIEVYIDAWCSLNGRFQQRMYDPRIDLLTAPWSPFQPVVYGLPLLTELSSWRSKIAEIERHVRSWSEYTDALFVADFPGLYLEHYVTEVNNVSLTVLHGQVVVELSPGNSTTSNKTLEVGGATPIPVHVLHRVHTVSAEPACYMYTFARKTPLDEQAKAAAQDAFSADITGADPGPDAKTWRGRLKQRWQNFRQAVGFVSNALLHVLYSVPMAKRVRIN